MKIGYLGAGTWGFTLAVLLAKNGHEVTLWTINKEICKRLKEGKDHPNLKGFTLVEGMKITTDLAEAIAGAEMVVEGVTSKGIRPVFEQVKALGVPSCPLVITSKGIEQGTGFLMSDLLIDVLGEDHRSQIGCLSGPSHAEEVIKGLPTSVVCSAYDAAVMNQIQEAFAAPLFRVYPNTDINGVEFSGAMKNIVAIACGLSDGLGFGDNTKAALMTRGLHEIRKLAVTKGCRPETLSGLAGMGDLCVTCLSIHSRNYRFGRLLAEHQGVEEAKKAIGMVVEGANTCVSAVELAEKLGIDVPISNSIYQIIYKGLTPEEAVQALMERVTKEEHL